MQMGYNGALRMAFILVHLKSEQRWN